MRHRAASIVLLVGGMFFVLEGHAAAQGPPVSVGVNGRGTPGTVPVWTGSGKTLTDSHIQDNGSVVNLSLPLQVSGGAGNGPAVVGSSTNGTGVSGFSSNNNGVTGSTSATNASAGVAGFGVQYGVLGFASATGVGWGVKGVASGTAVGVEGVSSGGVGIRGNMLDGNTPTAGDAGQFVAGAGGILLHVFLSNFNGPGGWDEKFVVDTAGNLTTYGNAYKPGGGSWSTLSDARTKKSIQPISNALGQLLKLHGVTFEYTNPSAFHEVPGTHLGMVAQDVEQVFPSWVDAGTDGYKRLTFRGFEAVAVEAVRELDTNSQNALARIAELERQNAELRHSIEVLFETVKTLQQK